jgi:CheY-like chemotaxis protein
LLSGRRKLLLADDSPTIQKVISLTFVDEGMEVVAVSDGRQALRALEEQEPPDILLADVVMPGPDGYELCEHVKRDGRLRHVPVVLLVGTFEPFNEAEARRVGADTVLTKPFQSIRDLVSKVGSLLGGGGGESKQEQEAAHDERPRTVEPAEEPRAPRMDATKQPEQSAPAGSTFDEHDDDALHADPASSFADLGADDELIEAKPADAFGAAAGYAAPSERVHSFARAQEPELAESQEPEHRAAPSHEANGNASPAPQPFDATSRTEEEMTGQADERTMNQTGEMVMSQTIETTTNQTAETATNQTAESVMPEQPSFDTRATVAAAADDALLDLGQIESPATVAAAEADDFVLDLDFEDELPLPSTQVTAGASVWADAPSAFAEAAHGEQPRHFTESASDFTDAASPLADVAPHFAETTSHFDDHASSFAEHASLSGESASRFGEHASLPVGSTSSFNESTSSFNESASSSGESSASFTQVELSAPSSETRQGHDLPAAEAIMQDGPQGFASYTEPQGVGAAPRGFVEPEVVPADEPVPAIFEGEFTDGSVEGDVPKAPAGYDATPIVEAAATAVPEMTAHETTASHETVAARETAASEPSTAGYDVGEARFGLEEPLRGDQLSREAIDAIARRVVELMSDKVVREIAWEVVPELAELLIKQRLDEERQK